MGYNIGVRFNFQKTLKRSSKQTRFRGRNFRGYDLVWAEKKERRRKKKAKLILEKRFRYIFKNIIRTKTGNEREGKKNNPTEQIYTFELTKK